MPRIAWVWGRRDARRPAGVPWPRTGPRGTGAAVRVGGLVTMSVGSPHTVPPVTAAIWARLSGIMARSLCGPRPGGVLPRARRFSLENLGSAPQTEAPGSACRSPCAMTVLLSFPRVAAVPVRDVDEPLVVLDPGFGSGKALMPGGMHRTAPSARTATHRIRQIRRIWTTGRSRTPSRSTSRWPTPGRCAPRWPRARGR